jgi:hypothetical protein
VTVRREGPGTAKVLAAIKGLDGLEGKTGWFETAHYPDGTAVAYAATIHEFGTPRIPARPFARPAVADHGGEWIQLLGEGAKASLNGGPAPEQVLEMVTLAAAGNVAEKIQAVTSPPLSPVTVARKGFDKPLVDTGQMLQSVTGKVERT